MLFTRHSLFLGFLIAVYFFSANLQPQNITLTITNIQSDKGQMVVSIFTNEDNFAKEKPVKKFFFPKKDVSNGTLTVQFELAPGTYGIALIDDEDGNKLMKKNMLGIPKEGFGFSNFYLSGLKPPSFNDFKFDLTEKPLHVESKLRYM